MPVKEESEIKRPHSIEERIHELERRRVVVRKGGGDERIEKQHKAGKLTARERVDRLVDPNSFQEIGLNFEPRILPCGHYTTGETPYKFIDGWYMGSFVYRAFKALREEKAAGLSPAPVAVEA